MPDFADVNFWVAVMQIIAIDIVLSGDNAIVIALACRSLALEQRRRGVFWGVIGAVGLRLVLTIFAATLLDLPWLKLIGALLLLWIGVKLLLPDDDEHDITAHDHLWGAVKTIIVADFVMSLDNVIAVAGASHGSVFLLVFGLLVSIPLIVWSSQLLMHWMERLPILVTLGAALLGYVAGGMMMSDPALKPFLPQHEMLNLAVSLGCAALVVGVGHLIAQRAPKKDITLS